MMLYSHGDRIAVGTVSRAPHRDVSLCVSFACGSVFGGGPRLADCMLPSLGVQTGASMWCWGWARLEVLGAA